MAQRFMQTMLTPSVLAAQQQYFGRSGRLPAAAAERDGWPYIQHPRRRARLSFG